MSGDTERLSDLGEEGLLARIFPLLPLGEHTALGPGDDAAVVVAPDGRVVATTDVLVGGRDFRPDWSSPQDVGAKAAAANLADIAAMGAVPTALLIALVAPADLDPAWATGLAEGVASACRGTGAGVVGGDLSSGDELVVAITALGDLEGRAPVRRDGASAGQVVAVTGALGRSGAGLALLLAGQGQDTGDAAALVAAHRRPTPDYAAGPAAALAGASAMLDVSDGLLRDAGRLARASGVVVDLDADALRADVDALRGVGQRLGLDPWDWVLAGGEDHGLLAVFGAVTDLPPGFRPIGVTRTVPPAGEAGVLVAGRRWTGPVGWDHFG